MAGRIDDVELTDRRDAPAPERQQAPQQRPAAQRPAPRQAPAQHGSGFADMDDDVPF